MQGHNCAEAVNFALSDWVALGRRATRCTCSALDDAVSLDVRLFKPEVNALPSPPGQIPDHVCHPWLPAPHLCPHGGTQHRLDVRLE